MKIVLALGGNALLQRNQAQTLQNQHDNIRKASASIAKISDGNELVVVHGNGPQVGLLMEQNVTYFDVKPAVPPYPMDVLSAETCGMIGCLLQQELYNESSTSAPISLITQTVVDKNDPAFKEPTKFVGPVYSKEEADASMKQRPGLLFKADGEYYRQVVASPMPKEILEVKHIESLLKDKCIVIAGGGGGIPVYRDESNKLDGIECVIDKDHTAALLSEEIKADMFIILTDGCVYENFSKPNQRSIKRISPEDLEAYNFPAGSMGPKVEAVCRFVTNTDKKAVIGSLFDLDRIIAGEAGTHIINNVEKEYYS